MIMKENEANEKRCVRDWQEYCIASDCMAWQWEDLGFTGGTAERGFCGLITTKGFNKKQSHCPF